MENSHNSHNTNHTKYYQRRQFCQLCLAGTLSIPLWLKFALPAEASGKATALVLSCIDFRFVDFEQNFLHNHQHLAGEYDLLTLAGASLALSNFSTESVNQTFWEELELSVNLHKINKVIILDHQDCGAYAEKIDTKLAENPLKEIELHTKYLNQANQLIKKRYPNLQVELYFVKLDGQVESIIS